MRIVVKIGTSSLTHASGELNLGAMRSFVMKLRRSDSRRPRSDGCHFGGDYRAGLHRSVSRSKAPRHADLQAAAAVGQSRLLRAYDEALGRGTDLVGGQILLSPNDFFERKQYLHARETIARLLLVNGCADH